MNLLQNPFYILNATPRDNRHKIVELSEERSLQIDPDECTNARLNLTNPRKRLSAEISWLIGVGPKQSAEIIHLLDQPVNKLLSVDNVTPIAKANLLASGLIRVPEGLQTPDDLQTHDIAEYIMDLADAFESVEPKDVYSLINEERVVSGFPEVTDISAIEEEISERRQYYKLAIKSTLDKLQPKDLVEVVTLAVEAATDDGEEQGLILIDDLVDAYETEAQTFLEKEAENIESLIEKIQQSVESNKADSILEGMVNQLVEIVKNWDTVAQPIQVSAKSRGLDHDASHHISLSVRNLAVYLFNKHGKLEFSQKLMNMLQEAFAEVDEIAERTTEDATALDNIAENRGKMLEQAKKREEKWKREITFETEVGRLFKDKLKISPDGVEWKGGHIPLESITLTRWGATRNYINGIPSGTNYTIVVGNNKKYYSIDPRRERIYNRFVDCLWKAVGVRILTDFLEGLREGKSYSFGSARVFDHGIELEKIKWVGNNEVVFCAWNDLVIWNEPGKFCIGKQDHKKIAATLSYQEDDNVHILEAAINTFWKRATKNISDLLED